MIIRREERHTFRTAGMVLFLVGAAKGAAP